jgi:ubiquinone/menaquinone biosynthesis C-methylase UbiE
MVCCPRPDPCFAALRETRLNSDGKDVAFVGSIPEFYDQYMVPLIFEPYAVDLARRAADLHPKHVLEIAAGTGVVTREMATLLPADVPIVATDLNQPMLTHAAAQGTARPVRWQQADAMQLPFTDQSFDLVVCQFGVMFFPDKAQAFAEARRVLQPGGHFIFSVWDRIDQNEFADAISHALADMFPEDPPRFMERGPHGYHDVSTIARDLKQGGFTALPQVTTLAERSRADSPRFPAIAYCHGTVWRSEIEERGPGRLAEATDRSALAIAERFGAAAVDGRIQAHIVTIAR